MRPSKINCSAHAESESECADVIVAKAKRSVAHAMVITAVAKLITAIAAIIIPILLFVMGW